MIFISNFFHVSNNTTYIIGLKRRNFNFEFPCTFDLFTDGKFIKKITVEGIVLDNNNYIDDSFDKITVWANGHLEKELIDDKIDAFLKIG